MTDQRKAGARGAIPLTSFNARTTPARQVAKSFVPPHNFYTLVSPDNSLLSGPRGSGKTTLLKMLQPEALEEWEHPIATHVRSIVNYTGVFIATDRAWKEQLLPRGDRPEAVAEVLRYLASSAFTTHVLRELTYAMAFRVHSRPPSELVEPHPRVNLDPRAELRLVRKLSNIAGLAAEADTLGDLSDLLTSRLVNLGGIRASFTDLRHSPNGPQSDVNARNWLDLDCLTLAEGAIELFNNAAGERSHQWALLFDELELAPPSIVEALIDAMRGQSALTLFKLSLSPVQPELAKLHLPNAGVHGQDFEIIRLTYPGQLEALGFARALMSAEILKREYEREVSAEQLLGASAFSSVDQTSEDDESDTGSRAKDPYAVGTELWQRYERLAESDPSFAEWLERNDVDLFDLGRLSPVDRASKLRKIRNLVVVREFFRSPERKRSRKSHSLYTGANALLTVVDGNPRMLKALVGQLLPASIPPSGRIPQVPRAEQSRALDSVLARFLALIRSLPVVEMDGGRTFEVEQLLDLIGSSLAAGVVEEPFNDNVPTCFRVDRGTPAHVVRRLQLALNAGAIVHIPKDAGQLVRPDLLGEEFRFSHILAPHYGLPLRLGKAVPLGRLLRMTRDGAWRVVRTSRGRRRGSVEAVDGGHIQETLLDANVGGY